MKLKNLETENFRVTTDTDGKLMCKATTAIAKAYYRLKKHSNPMQLLVEGNGMLLTELEALESSVEKLKGI